MPYQPGPLLLQDAANVGVTTSTYNFSADADTQLQELTLTPATWENFLFDAGVLLDGPADPFPDVDLNGAIDMLNAYADPPTEIGVNVLQDSLGTANLGLAAAIGYAPAEAWYDASTPFVPPAPAPIVNVPVIPASDINFEVTGTVATGGSPTGPSFGAIPLSVTLTNLTAYGNPVFHVGDQFEVAAVGVPGQPVQVSGSHDGTPFPIALMGNIGNDGTFKLDGQEDFASVGVWEEVWWVGGQQVATFNFIVLDQ